MDNNIPKAMILAAGLGTRMRPFTNHRPKPLVSLAGKALIDHALDALMLSGVSDAVVNLHYLGDMLEKHLKSRSLPRIQFSDERNELLDTGGGVKKALGLLGADAFLILNSDSVWTEEKTPNLVRLTDAWDDENMDCLLLVARRAGALGYEGPGDFNLHQDGRVSRCVSGGEADYVHTGVCMIHPRAFENTPEGAFSLNIVWDRLLERGRLSGLGLTGQWMHAGTPQALDLARNRLLGTNS